MYKDLDEQTLARHCSRKDRMAEDELYRRYAARLHTLGKRYLGDEDDAKDLMLDTYRTENPLMFSLASGLRFTFGK